MSRRLLAAAAAAFLLAGCGAMRPKVEQRTTEGPTAEEFWTLRIAARTGRGPSFEERRTWDDAISAAIDGYLQRHPEVSNSPQLMTFRFLRQASVGMDKEQILILLGQPVRRSAEAAAMEKDARRFWPEIKDTVSELWAYPYGWNLFFKDDRLVEIVQFRE